MADWTDWLSNNAGAIGALGLGAVMGSMNGSQQAGTTTSTTAPWGPQQPYLLDIFNRAGQMSQNPGVSADMQSAFNGMQGAVNNGLGAQAQGVISNTLNKDPSQYYGIGRSNPYMGQTTNAVQNPYLTGGMNNPYLQQSMQFANDQTMRSMMPAYNQAQAASGSFGNSGVADYFGNAMGNAIAGQNNQTMNNQFNTNLAAQQSLGFGNAQLQSADLTRNSNLAQTGINNDLSQYNTGMSTVNNAAFNAPQFGSSLMGNYGQLYNAASLNNNAQWNPLNNYSNLVRGSYGGSSSTPYYTNPVAGAIGGAAAGAGIYSNLFGNKA